MSSAEKSTCHALEKNGNYHTNQKGNNSIRHKLFKGEKQLHQFDIPWDLSHKSQTSVPNMHLNTNK